MAKESTKPRSMFEQLLNVDVSDNTYQKPANKAETIWLTYLNWSWAWSYLMFYDPNAKLEFVKYPEYDFESHSLTGRKVDYMNTINGAYVTAKLTIKSKIDGKNHTNTQTLPVMDATNRTKFNPGVTDINKAKQRAFVKCFALFGLGLGLFMDESHKNKGKRNGKKSSGGSKGDYNAESMKGKPATSGQQNFVNSLVRRCANRPMNKRQQSAYNYASNNKLADFDRYTCSKIIDVLSTVKSKPSNAGGSGNAGNSNNSRRPSDKIGSTGKAKQGSLM